LQDSKCDYARKSKKGEGSNQRLSSVARDNSVASDVPAYVCKDYCGNEHPQHRLPEFEAWRARGHCFDPIKRKPSPQGRL
jgi:hypothetical protein